MYTELKPVDTTLTDNVCPLYGAVWEFRGYLKVGANVRFDDKKTFSECFWYIWVRKGVLKMF